MINPDKTDASAGSGFLYEAPAMAAAKILGGLIAECQKQGTHGAYAAIDLRAIEDIQRKLQADPNDAGAKQWIRQLAQTWSIRIRDNTRSVRKVLDLLDTRR